MITFTRGAKSVTIESPQLGDVDQFTFPVTIHITLEGEIFTYTNQKITRKFLMHFTEIPLAQYNLFRAFLKTEHGKLLTYTDYNGNNFLGIILSDPFEVNTIRKNMYSFPLEFAVQ